MVDALKDIVGILDKLPQYTIWVLLGLLFYKIVIIGSWFSIARLLINRAYSFVTFKKELPVQNVIINEKFVTTDFAYQEFLSVIDTIMSKRNLLREPIAGVPGNYQFMSDHTYLNLQDIKWFKRVVIEAADIEEAFIRKAVFDKKDFPDIEKELNDLKHVRS